MEKIKYKYTDMWGKDKIDCTLLKIDNVYDALELHCKCLNT